MIDFLTMKDLYEKYKEQNEESRQKHAEDGLFAPIDITIYIDDYRKHIKKRNGSEFTTVRMNPEQIDAYVGQSFRKKYYVTRVDTHHFRSTVWLKENRTK